MPPRNTEFSSPARLAPFASNPYIRVVPDSIEGPLPFFNPTRARFHITKEPKHAKPTEEGRPTTDVAVPQATVNWRSRDNRKGEKFRFLFLSFELIALGIGR